MTPTNGRNTQKVAASSAETSNNASAVSMTCCCPPLLLRISCMTAPLDQKLKRSFQAAAAGSGDVTDGKSLSHERAMFWREACRENHSISETLNRNAVVQPNS